MNNLYYLSFERNNYYNGKLLSADDFEAEQKYINDKRRLINRFVGGFGRVCGLDVLAVSDDSISLEPGIAIDGYGREIVVSEPDIKKLSSINGYDKSGMASEYYLFIEYSEKAVFPSNAAAYADQREYNENKYNKISEGYSLYLSQTIEAGDAGSVIEYYKSDVVIFRNNELKVGMLVPRFIKAAERFRLTIYAAPRNVSSEISMKFRISLTCVRHNGNDAINVDFNSNREKISGRRYILEYYCDSMNITDDLAEFRIDSESFRIETDGVVNTINNEVLSEAVMTDKPVCDCVSSEYINKIMEYSNYSIFKNICIAKIILSDSHELKIETIEHLPLEQRLYTNAQLALENEVLKDRLDVLIHSSFENTKQINSANEVQSDIEISSGDAVINFGIGGKTGKRFFSEKISHGLGIGDIAIILGTGNSKAEEKCMIYGSSEVFDGNDGGIRAEIAAKVNQQDGTFVIGARLLETTSEYELTVHWTAIKHSNKFARLSEKKLIIDCGAKSVRALESVYFSVKFVNMNETAVRWSVIGDNSGTINDNGYYTAPGHPGIYEIRVHCAYDKSIKASAFVVVKP